MTKDLDTITPEATAPEALRLMEDGGYRHVPVELAMAFEDEFDCEIPDAAADKIVTVKDAVILIEQIA